MLTFDSEELCLAPALESAATPFVGFVLHDSRVASELEGGLARRQLFVS